MVYTFKFNWHKSFLGDVANTLSSPSSDAEEADDDVVADVDEG